MVAPQSSSDCSERVPPQPTLQATLANGEDKVEVNLILHLLVKPATICSERDTLPRWPFENETAPSSRRALLPVLQKRNSQGFAPTRLYFGG